jgi:hypothetical protein
MVVSGHVATGREKSAPVGGEPRRRLVIPDTDDYVARAVTDVAGKLLYLGPAL